MIKFVKSEKGGAREGSPFEFVAVPPVVVATGSFTPPPEVKDDEAEKPSKEKQ
jgi:hypothetical protein